MDAKKKALDKRLDSIGWGLFLIMIGGLWLSPEGMFPEGTWLIGTGLVILVLMGIRCLYGIKVNSFWLILGVVALAFGMSDVFGLNIPVFPILIIIIGVSIVFNHWSRRSSQSTRDSFLLLSQSSSLRVYLREQSHL